MTAGVHVLGRASVDEVGVRGTGGVDATWASLGVAAPGTPATFRALFGRRDATFRRLDRVARTLVVAAAALDIEAHLDAELRRRTAIVIESVRGCLDTDVRFARTLSAGEPEGPLFAYTLPSTGLGEVAMRHGLSGPTWCLSIAGDGAGVADAEARAILRGGEAPAVLVGRVEVLEGARPGVGSACRAALELVALGR